MVFVSAVEALLVVKLLCIVCVWNLDRRGMVGRVGRLCYLGICEVKEKEGNAPGENIHNKKK